MMRFTATLTGAGAMAPQFEGLLDGVVNGVILGDETRSIVSLVFDVYAWRQSTALARAVNVAATVIAWGSDNDHDLHISVQRGRR